MGDACYRCGGHGQYPTVPGDYSRWTVCKHCGGTGRHGPRDLGDKK